MLEYKERLEEARFAGREYEEAVLISGESGWDLNEVYELIWSAGKM